jgi:hypothetical protein
MAANVKPYEVIVGAADVYFAPTGTTFPSLSDTYTPGSGFGGTGTAWKKVGYTDGGVKVGHPQTIVEIRTDQVTAPIKAVRSEESLEITCNIVTLSNTNYALALNQAIAGPTTGGSDETLDLYRGGSQVETFAFLVRGDHHSSHGDFPRQYEVPVVFQADSPEVEYIKDGASVLACSFHAIADPDRSSDAETFGVLREGTA